MFDIFNDEYRLSVGASTRKFVRCILGFCTYKLNTLSSKKIDDQSQQHCLPERLDFAGGDGVRRPHGLHQLQVSGVQVPQVLLPSHHSHLTTGVYIL